MTRKLATIQRIKQLISIPGADKIEVALINGWQVVTQKGQHAEGDLVVFYEIDSWLPASDPRYASFEERFTTWGDKRGMRLKTIKLRKTLSQGLIMPLKDFPEIMLSVHWNTSQREGLDVTDILKIEKWEQIEKENTSTMAAKTRSFPFFIRKTDQERVQNYGPLVVRALDEEFEVTVKKDGSSMTVFRVDPNSEHYKEAKAMLQDKKQKVSLRDIWDYVVSIFVKPIEEPVYGICSRNVLLPLKGDSNFHHGAENVLMKLELESMFANTSVAIQGELVAPNIQDNYEKVEGVEFHVFDIFNIDKQEYMLPVERAMYCKLNGLRHVTVVDKGTIRNIVKYADGDDVVQKLLTYASGPGDSKGVDREGVVFKSLSRDFSFKAVSNEYLLKTGK